MSCISVKISRVEQSPVVSALRVGDGLSTEVELVNKPISAEVSDVAQHLSVAIGLVCSVNGVPFEISLDNDALVFTNDDIGKPKLIYLNANAEWVIREMEDYGD